MADIIGKNLSTKSPPLSFFLLASIFQLTKKTIIRFLKNSSDEEMEAGEEIDRKTKLKKVVIFNFNKMKKQKVTFPRVPVCRILCV